MLNHPILETGVQINDANILYATDERIPAEKQISGYHYYNMRMSKHNSLYPFTIEPFVMVNFYGTIVTDKKIMGLDKLEVNVADEQSNYPSLLQRAILALVEQDINSALEIAKELNKQE